MPGADILDRLRAALRSYVVLPSESALDAVVLWIAATHAIEAWTHATRLVIKSPEKRCGKSRLLDIIEALVHRPLMTMNATTAALFRSLEGDRPPTLLFDEADAIFGTVTKAEQSEDLRGLLNAGFGRGRPVLRTVGPTHTVAEFSTFAMVALASIGDLPTTIEDRAVIVAMRRRGHDETVLPYRQRRDRPGLDELRAELAEWVASVVSGLVDAEPELPVEDRAGDVWEPLAAIADAAGGRWPAAARSAALALSAAADEADLDRSLGIRLLADVRACFAAGQGTSFMSSAALANALRDIDDAPWRDVELTPRRLAARLRPYGIKPGHNSAKTERGFRLESLLDAFDRYLPAEGPKPSERPQASDSGASAADASGPPDASNRPRLTAVPADRPEVSERPTCSECHRPNLFAPASIERGICAACIQRSTA
jgi:Protein of unknown function (DUF3631)